MARRRSGSRHRAGVCGLARKSRWTVEEARVVLAAQSESGEAVAAFARRHGLGLPRLYAWRRRLGLMGTAVPATRLLPVRIATERGGSAELIEIELRGGRRLRVSEAVDPAALGRVVEVLERTC